MSLTRRSGFLLVLALAVSLIVLLVSLATGRTSAQTPDGELDKVQKVLDHFKCWTVNGGPADRTVFLHDQFDFETDAAGNVHPTFETVVVRDPTVFCNATRKIHPVDGGQITAGISDVNNHLTCYDMDADTDLEHHVVEVRNQFGVQQLAVEFPLGLCVPTQKVLIDGDKPEFGGDFPRRLDHFKCHEVIGAAPENVRVELQDQFGGPTFTTVQEPRALCNPARKAVFRGFTSAQLTSDAVKWEVTAVRHPDGHLVCYEITPESFEAELEVRNQFGTQEMSVSGSELLCVPSLKRVLDGRTGG